MIYLFFGEDKFSLNEEVKRLIKTNLPPEAEDFNLAKLDALKSGFGLPEVLNATEAFPFLSDKRVVVVSGLVTKLSKSAASEERAAAKAARTGKGKSEKPKSPREQFLDYIPNIPASTILVITEEKVAKSDLIYKAVEKHGAVRDFEPLKDWELEKWIGERAAQKQIKIDRNAVQLIREFLGADLYRIDNELDKLAAFAGEGQRITVPMVEEMTAEISETKIWALTDALTSRNLAGVMELLHRLRRESTLNDAGFTRQVFALVSSQIFKIIRVKEMYGQRRNVNEIAQATSMGSYQIEKLLPYTRGFQAEQLDRIYARLTEIDHADKTGKVNLETQLDLLVAEICQK